MRVGHEWLRRTFNATPRVGWHPDSFSSTSSVPTVYALSGLTTLFHDRMDDAVKSGLHANRSMEFVWQGSSAVHAPRLWTHIMDGHTGCESTALTLILNLTRILPLIGTLSTPGCESAIKRLERPEDRFEPFPCRATLRRRLIRSYRCVRVPRRRSDESPFLKDTACLDWEPDQGGPRCPPLVGAPAQAVAAAADRYVELCFNRSAGYRHSEVRQA